MQLKLDKWTPGAAIVAPPILDIWEYKPTDPPCAGKHGWVRYISMKFRECTCCGEREALWADFGMLGNPIKPD